MKNSNLRRSLAILKKELGFVKVSACDESSNAAYREMIKKGRPLPDNVVPRYEESEGSPISEFCILEDAGMSEEAKLELIRLRNTYLLGKVDENVRTIKNIMVFFAVLAVLGIIAVLITFLVTRCR